MTRRRNRGMSLVTIMLIGLVASLWILTLMGLILPSFNRATTSRCEIALRSAAETAVDWGVTQLNVNYANVDDTTDDGAPGPVISVPSDVLGNYGYNVTATVQVSNEKPPTSSYIYDPTLDPANSASNGGISTNGWRVVSATATAGRLSKTVRVISKPNYTTSPTFNYGAFGRVNVTVGGTGITDSYDSSGSYSSTVKSTGGNVGTNGTVSLIGNAVIGGDVTVLSDPPGSTNQVVSGTTNVQIKGTLSTNGSLHTNGSGPDFSTTNVLGNLPDGSVSSNPIETQQYDPQRQIPAAPSAPSGSTDLGAVSVTKGSLTLTAPGDLSFTAHA